MALCIQTNRSEKVSKSTRSVNGPSRLVRPNLFVRFVTACVVCKMVKGSPVNVRPTPLCHVVFPMWVQDMDAAVHITNISRTLIFHP